MPCIFCKQDHPWTVEQALEMLDRGPRQLREAVAGASEPELSFPEPKPGGWSPKQVAIHLMDTELIWSVRRRKLLAENNPDLPAFDQNLWSDALSGGRETEDAVRTLELLRKQNLALIRSAPAPKGALDRTGRHPEYGKLTIRDMVMHGADHDAKHATQIKRIRTAWAKSRA